jgi:lipopolysaccharide heptosyltransferase II
MAAIDNWQAIKNVLCVRLDNIGDVLMTTPAIRGLKAFRPDRRITLLTSSVGARVARLIPELDRVIVYDAPWMKSTEPLPDSRSERVIVEQLRREKFDAAIIFTVYSQNPLPSAFLCFLADIPLRLAHCHENPYQLLTHWVPDPEPERYIRHEVRRQLDLVGAVGARINDERMSLRLPSRSKQRVRKLLNSLELDDGHPWVVIHPGASAPSRRYPPESFAQAARYLARDLGCRLVFTGGEQERELVENVRAMSGVPSVSLAGHLSCDELAALISLSPVLISNNTGPVHLASALGVKVVDLYALTNPQHMPWKVPNRVLFHDVPCKFCYKSVCPEGHHDCLRLVTPDTVAGAACELLEERSFQPAEAVL